ncbi:hypothetical protein HMPREF3145_03515 [Corynebacterium sp. HMSC05C01]|uniref:hypothetical protein n=1 Tax=Corynebacterium TaxID=1716 RepID=UPI0008A319FB|nr:MULTISPECIES: hypothetical protein [Corynebacterium]MDK8823423.1 hypothetical protein [Corynebacterium coyleae]OFT71222.1 hypothetical protein HMPREF3145_03515 [Corynebacterium sp. HMSC05C01]
MKRIATAAVAATMSLTALATPAFAAEETPSSSEAYKKCVDGVKEDWKWAEDAPTEAEKAERKKIVEASYKEAKVFSSTPSGTCIKGLVQDEDYKSGALGLLIGVPVALVALLGAAAAFSGAIPGVQLPALPF